MASFKRTNNSQPQGLSLMAVKTLSQSDRYEIKAILNAFRESQLTALNASDPEWTRRIEERKQKVAIGKLKIEKDVAEMDEIDNQIRALRQKRDEIELRISKKMPTEARTRNGGCPGRKSMCESINEIATRIHDSVMMEDAAGAASIAIDNDHRRRLSLLVKCETREDVNQLKVLDDTEAG